MADPTVVGMWDPRLQKPRRNGFWAVLSELEQGPAYNEEAPGDLTCRGVSIQSGSFCGRPCSKRPVIWGLYLFSGCLETVHIRCPLSFQPGFLLWFGECNWTKGENDMSVYMLVALANFGLATGAKTEMGYVQSS